MLNARGSVTFAQAAVRSAKSTASRGEIESALDPFIDTSDWLGSVATTNVEAELVCEHCLLSRVLMDAATFRARPLYNKAGELMLS